MKAASTTLLTLFCVLLVAQMACATGWGIHEVCTLDPNHDDHGEVCEWDPCNQTYDSPAKSKLDSSALELVPSAGTVVENDADAGVQQQAVENPPPGSTTPRPAGNFPLLI